MDLHALLSTVNGILAIGVVLGLCLFVHEAGHFLAAKLFGCNVHEFALGFGPPIFSRTWGETDYRLNVFPLGGYVRIAGMEPGSEAVQGGFHSIPRWQGGVVIVAGVTMNIVLALVVFTLVPLFAGVPDSSDDRVLVRKVLHGEPAEKAGLQPGDEVVAVEGSRHSITIASIDPAGAAARAGLTKTMVIDTVEGESVYLPVSAYTLARNTDRQQVTVGAVDRSVEDISNQLRHLKFPKPPAGGGDDATEATRILEGSWGLEFEDLTTGALVGAIGQRPDQPVDLTIKRDGEVMHLTVPTAVEYARRPVRSPDGTVRTPHRPVGKIGAIVSHPVRKIGITQAIEQGVRSSYQSVMMVVFGVKAMISKEIESGAGGPVAIMAMSAEQAKIGWSAVFNWVGIISANLAIINLAPIPPFDGFRVLLLGYEGVLRRRIDEQKELILTLAGFILIICFVVIITFHDIVNLVRYGTP